MINKHLDRIELDDLRALQLNAVSEGKTIEYKQNLPGGQDSDRKEYLADVSSFANASGGDLLFGITEGNGIPQSIDGVVVTNVDEEIRKYENLIRDGIEPRILLATRVVTIADDKFVFIFRINKSWNGPHRVIYKGHDKFYSRNSAGKYPLDTTELRAAFNLSQTLTEQITRFKTERIAQLVANETPVPFVEGGKIVLHLIPLEAFSPNYRIDLASIVNDLRQLKPIHSSGWSLRINLEGVLSYSGGRNNKCHSYVQLYRKGTFEAVEGSILRADRERKIIPSHFYESELLNSLSQFLNLAKGLGINMPIVVFLTLIGVKGWELGVDISRFRSEDHYEIDRDILQLPEAIVESYEAEARQILRPMFDLIWNTCGYKKSPNFDESENFIEG